MQRGQTHGHSIRHGHSMRQGRLGSRPVRHGQNHLVLRQGHVRLHQKDYLDQDHLGRRGIDLGNRHHYHRHRGDLDGCRPADRRLLRDHRAQVVEQK
jgi:hypothetical protein